MDILSLIPSQGLLPRMADWVHVDSSGELALLVFGLLAQGLFLLRWIVQWLSSERRASSHVPESFWWISLAGASLLLVYFALRGEPVGILGQGVGWIVYIRNIQLIHRNPRSHCPGEARENRPSHAP